MVVIWDVINTIYHRIRNGIMEGLALFRAAGREFVIARAPEAAAGIAYYALFSLFPLLLVFIAVGSFILEEQFIRNQLMAFIPEFFPVVQQEILRSIETVLSSRGTVTVIGMIGLLWSATSVFYLLSLNINRAWTTANQRSYIRRRLIALGIVGAFVALLLGLMFVNQVFQIIIRYKPPWIDPSFFATSLWQNLSHILFFLLKFAILFLLYWWIPNTRVNGKAALWGAAFSSFTLELTRLVFYRLVRLGWIHYELVYGTIGVVITFLLWVYLMSWIVLFGAHLSARIDERYGKTLPKT